MKITDFLDNEVGNFASYSVLRAIPSLIDGQKNASRKVIYYMSKYGNKDEKLFNLEGKIQSEVQYLHGSIGNVIVNLAKNYLGSNNLPLLTREGNFGARFNNSAAALRYIYTAKEKYFDNLFIKEDSEILIKQEFEGQKIEPRFFVPTLPIILINGSEGIATGFACKILPRKTEEIIKYLKNEKSNLKPFFKGFKGKIIKGEKLNQWKILGIFKRVSKTELLITEIPVGYELSNYISILDKLEDLKIIKSYIDLSDNDIFKFKIKVDINFLKENSDEDILIKLKLIKTITENFTVIDEFNKIKQYTKAEEIIDHYKKIKNKYNIIRKKFIQEKKKNELLLISSKLIFLKGVIENKIIINRKTKTEIINQLMSIKGIIKYNTNYDYLLKIPIYNLSNEKIIEIENLIILKKGEYKQFINRETEEIWKTEITNLFSN